MTDPTEKDSERFPKWLKVATQTALKWSGKFLVWVAKDVWKLILLIFTYIVQPIYKEIARIVPEILWGIVLFPGYLILGLLSFAGFVAIAEAKAQGIKKNNYSLYRAGADAEEERRLSKNNDDKGLATFWTIVFYMGLGWYYLSDSSEGESTSISQGSQTSVEERATKEQVLSPRISVSSSTKPPRQTGGAWGVNLESHTSRFTANERAASLENKLHPLSVSILNAEVDGKDYYRVRVAGFTSEAIASRASDWISAQTSAGPYWLSKAEVKDTPTENSSEKLTRAKCRELLPSYVEEKDLQQAASISERDGKYCVLNYVDEKKNRVVRVGIEFVGTGTGWNVVGEPKIIEESSY